MLGAIAGDVIGSIYERGTLRTTRFPLFSPRSRFTDDSVLTVATAEALLTGGGYGEAYHDWGCRYPAAGYGGMFIEWLKADEPAPYGSFGNGSAMRVSPVGWLCRGREEVLEEARRSAVVSHDHAEGIRGAQAIALAVFLARTGASKEEISREIEGATGYELSRPWAEVHASHRWDVACQGSVPPAIQAFLEAPDFEGAVRNAVSLGGDADTQACMAGAIAEAFYGGLPPAIEHDVRERLPTDMLDVLARFSATLAG